jgi:hypothetical protein
VQRRGSRQVAVGRREADCDDTERAAALYREAIDGLSLYSYPPSTIDVLSQACEILRSASADARDKSARELFRLANYYLNPVGGGRNQALIRSSLCADLSDRNGPARNDVTGQLDRIDDAAYYARGHGSFMAIMPLYRELFREVESSFRFPDLDVSDWLFGFGGLLLSNGNDEEGELRLQQSVDMEALLSGEVSQRIAERLQWRGARLANRDSSRAEADLVRAINILSTLDAPERDLVERTINALGRLQDRGISSEAVSAATRQGSACLARAKFVEAAT